MDSTLFLENKGINDELIPVYSQDQSQIGEIRLSELLDQFGQKAFLAGFKITGEGYNYEYPYQDYGHNDEEIWDDIKDRYERAPNN